MRWADKGAHGVWVVCPCASDRFQHLDSWFLFFFFLLRCFTADCRHRRHSAARSDAGRCPAGHRNPARPEAHVSVSACNRNRGDATAVRPFSLSIGLLAPLIVRARAARPQGNSRGCRVLGRHGGLQMLADVSACLHHITSRQPPHTPPFSFFLRCNCLSWKSAVAHVPNQTQSCVFPGLLFSVNSSHTRSHTQSADG